MGSDPIKLTGFYFLSLFSAMGVIIRSENGMNGGTRRPSVGEVRYFGASTSETVWSRAGSSGSDIYVISS